MQLFRILAENQIPMRVLFLLSLSFCYLFAAAQDSPRRAVVQLETLDAAQRQTTEAKKILLEGVAPFLAYSVTWEGDGEEISIRFSRDGVEWEEWLTLHRDPHSFYETEKRVSELGFGEPEFRFFQLQASEGFFENIECHFYNPGRSDERETARPVETGSSRECPCPQPEYLNRDAWCPGGNCPPNSSPANTTVTHLIVHHSAGTNTSSDWAAVVRSIWDYHVNSNGWADVGYNWLIDPNGVLYEGRGDNILGAHFCGTNSGTMGVCVLGNFQLVEPSVDSKETLKKLLAWKACDRDLDPLGSGFHSSSGLVLMRISGHRDGCATLCPGDLLYPQLPAVREEVAAFIADECEDVSVTNEFFNNHTVRLFPNPAEAAFQVAVANDLYGKLQFAITDLNGRTVSALFEREKITPQQTFDLNAAGLPSGVYLLRISHGNESAAFPVVKLER
jgi:hypothetical protein